jgi:hypothetical protein
MYSIRISITDTIGDRKSTDESGVVKESYELVLRENLRDCRQG